MAGQDVNTPKCEVSLDALEAALDRVDYAHGMAGLLTEQRDFELPHFSPQPLAS
ncbi:hypothetical protein [Salmonella enterica]|uniref:hypothetical protein n=1 Tax=Salmonella enterica TaxID=28901 RepID=UPI003315616F